MALPLTAEDIRAQAWRAAQVRREANERRNEQRLAGSEVAARRVRDNWQPFIDWINERSIDGCGQEG